MCGNVLGLGALRHTLRQRWICVSLCPVFLLPDRMLPPGAALLPGLKTPPGSFSASVSATAQASLTHSTNGRVAQVFTRH